MSAGIARENKHVEGDRLFVRVTYPDGADEEFEWQLFTAPEMNALADSVGFSLIAFCTDFDMDIEPSPSKARIQFVLERRD